MRLPLFFFVVCLLFAPPFAPSSLGELEGAKDETSPITFETQEGALRLVAEDGSVIVACATMKFLIA